MATPTSTSTSISTSTPDGHKERICKLLSLVPELNGVFTIHRKIGEGSFSCVYLASLNREDHLPPHRRRLFAVKHLLPISHPNRMEQELRCLKYIGGCENVVGIDFCIRKYNTVIFVMPYLPHGKFSEYVLKMDADETKTYMKNLFTALKRVHKFNIIHRDIKPNNFLYDRENRRFLLVDFGLAQKIDVWPSAQNGHLLKDTYQFDIYRDSPTENEVASSRRSDAPTTPSKVNAVKRKFDEANVSTSMSEPTPKRPASMDSTSNGGFPLKPLQEDHPKISPGAKTATSRPNTRAEKLEQVKRQVFLGNSENKIDPMAISPYRNGLVPAMPPYGSYSYLYGPPVNSLKHYSDYSYYLGIKAYLESIEASASNAMRYLDYNGAFKMQHSADLVEHYYRQQPSGSIRKPPNGIKKARVENQTADCKCIGKPRVCSICLKKGEYKAPRAGTHGFRPPEVLLKYTEQTTAVDMWACGVILLSIVSGCYPFFHAPDDITALAEIVTIFGHTKLKRVADVLGRHLMCSYKNKALDLRKLCTHLRRRALANHEKRMTPADEKNENSSSNSSKFKSPKEISCSDCGLSLSYCICYEEGKARSNFNPYVTIDSNGRKTWCGFPDEAFDLLEKLMDPNPHTRITASDALQHPFLADL